LRKHKNNSYYSKNTDLETLRLFLNFIKSQDDLNDVIYRNNGPQTKVIHTVETYKQNQKGRIQTVFLSPYLIFL